MGIQVRYKALLLYQIKNLSRLVRDGFWVKPRMTINKNKRQGNLSFESSS